MSRYDEIKAEMMAAAERVPVAGLPISVALAAQMAAVIDVAAKRIASELDWADHPDNPRNL